MLKRTKIKEFKGWDGIYTEYTLEGYDSKFTADENDWKRYEITYLLVSQGVSESLLDELYDIGYDEGSSDSY